MLTCDIGHETLSVNETHNHSKTHSSAINFREYRQSKEDNSEKLATHGTQDEKTNKQKNKLKHNTIYVLDTTIRKQTQIT